MAHAPHQPEPDPTPHRRRPPIAAYPFLGVIWLYRFTLSPFLGGQCRFYPTCSQYALDAYHLHPPLRATWLTIRRLSRCHPLGGRGPDPVPRPSEHRS